mmetsp:Transcript_14416/g.32171  ORF Transcript_14416/g.32171 Transcript_14416/m.32171 type:complete len:521 (-) Transcript_14416:165-1727(-)
MASTYATSLRAAARLARSSRRPNVASSGRCLGTKARESINFEPIPPNHTIDSVKPPKHWASPGEAEPDPNAYVRKPVTSAHIIDLSADPPRVSARDSVAIGPTGSVQHGRYGELGPDIAAGIPLEYLALLRPAAEAVAAVKAATAKGAGTVLVYGATQPAGLAAVQLASTSGNAVVAVVGGEHSGNDEMVDVVKGMATEPGTAVAEEYALVKGAFRDLVGKTSTGDDPSTWGDHDADAFLEDFKTNLLDYTAAYPDNLPAAVSKDKLLFSGKEKDRKNFRANMDAYLSQFPPGEAPIDPEQLNAYFPKEQYALWKSKFGQQTTAVISGDDTPDFVPARLVRNQMASPDPVDESILKAAEVPYEFDVLRPNYGTGADVPSTLKGGPVTGAIIAVTPDLAAATQAVEKAGKSIRAKAEALQFLPAAQQNAYAAARSVIQCAEAAGGSVTVVGGELPGFKAVEAGDPDVKEAISAMEIAEDGTSRLNFFLQVYRAGDYPVYADYAVHRATEDLAGPRIVVVTK